MPSLVEAVLLSAALVPLIRLYALRGIRRRFNSSPYGHLLFIAIFLFYPVLLIALAVFLPLVLHLAFLAGVAVFLYFLWRARPRYGKGSGLAPGSLELFPLEPWTNVGYYEKQFRKYGPVFKSSDLHRPLVNILGIERARQLLAQHSESLVVPPPPFNGFIPKGFLRYLPPKQHQTVRPIFQSVLSSAVTRQAEPYLTRAVQRELASMAAASQSSADGVSPEPYLVHIVERSLAHLFFGIDFDTELYAQWQALFHVIDTRRAYRVPAYQVKQALAKLVPLLQAHAGRETRFPFFLSELKHAHPDTFSDLFFILNLIYMYQISMVDLLGLLRWLVKMLSDNPEWTKRLREATTPADLPPRIVLETLRLQQIEYLLRQTVRDIRFENFLIPKGWFIRIAVKESHHLSSAFEDAESFNPDRFLGRRYSHSEYMPFGAFNKSCLGEHETLTIAKTFVTELARTYQWRVATDGPQEFNGFHWQPNTRFRIALTQIDL